MMRTRRPSLGERQAVEQHWAAGEEVAGQRDRLPGALVEPLAQRRPLRDLDAGEVRQRRGAGAEVGAGDGGGKLRELPARLRPLLEGGRVHVRPQDGADAEVVGRGFPGTQREAREVQAFLYPVVEVVVAERGGLEVAHGLPEDLGQGGRVAPEAFLDLSAQGLVQISPLRHAQGMARPLSVNGEGSQSFAVILWGERG